jgi:putative DNA primase/helicase
MTGQDVVQQMEAAGLDAPPTPLNLHGKVVRFGPKKRHWYRLREVRTDGGSFVVVGSFGDWRGGERHRVDVDWQGISEAEREQLQARRQAQEQAEQARRQLAAAQAAMSAAELWASAARTGHSAYLERKGVEAESCRFLPDSIVVPLLRYDEPRESALKAVQRIWPNGDKRFTRGFSKPGVCLRLGHVVVGQPVLICEGYATGLTLRMATARRLPVVVALDAGNLAPVAELLRSLIPHGELLICADDDWRTPGNPGREKAHKAARAVDRCRYTWPVFRPGLRGQKDTDFNDLHAREGLHAVRRQLRHVLPRLGSDVLNELSDAA